MSDPYSQIHCKTAADHHEMRPNPALSSTNYRCLRTRAKPLDIVWQETCVARMRTFRCINTIYVYVVSMPCPQASALGLVLLFLSTLCKQDCALEHVV
jgi:hypothetical protein